MRSKRFPEVLVIILAIIMIVFVVILFNRRIKKLKNSTGQITHNFLTTKSIQNETVQRHYTK